MERLVIKLIFFVTVVNSDTSIPLFRPQLPVGEYRIQFLALMRCESIERIKFNYYLSKTSANTTDIKGNATYLVPIDDYLSIEVNMAVKDSIGGWKDNAHIFKTPKACSSLKMLMGNNWSPVLKSLGVQNTNCPIAPGCYVASGIKQIDKIFPNLPKQFFYGTYKFRFRFTKNKEVYGCGIAVIKLSRPWESD